jgi:hypothetical protein
MKANRKRKWKSMSLKVQHLQLELEEREEALKAFEEEFLSALSQIEVEEGPSAQPNSPPPQVVSTSPEDIIEKEVPPEAPEDMKTLWRAIAVETHPDKTGGDTEKEAVYKRAAEAWKDRKYGDLYRIALELGIDIPESETNWLLLEEMEVNLQAQIDQKERSVLWEWGNAPPEKKDKILAFYLASKGKRVKRG